MKVCRILLDVDAIRRAIAAVTRKSPRPTLHPSIELSKDRSAATSLASTSPACTVSALGACTFCMPVMIGVSGLSILVSDAFIVLCSIGSMSSKCAHRGPVSDGVFVAGLVIDACRSLSVRFVVLVKVSKGRASVHGGRVIQVNR